MTNSPNRSRLVFLGALLTAAAVAAVIVLVTGGDEEAGAGASASAAPDGECAEVEAPEPKDVSFDEPEDVLERGQEATAVVETSCGSFEIALDTEENPRIANSFAFLAGEGFYDGTVFHRIAPGFVIQGGDPQGTGPQPGSGGPGYSVREVPPQDTSYTRGLVAMAKSEVEPPGTSGSQFFVVTAPADAGLQPDYAVLGEVTEGIDVAEAIGELGDASEQPTQTVTIDSVTIETG